MWTPPTPEQLAILEEEELLRRFHSFGFDASTFGGTARVLRCLGRQRSSNGYTYSQYLSLNLDRLPAQRAAEVLDGPSAVLSNNEFSVKSDTGPVVLGTRRVEITDRPNYLRSSVNMKLRLRTPPPPDPAPVLPGPFSIDAQRTALGLQDGPHTTIYSARVLWHEDSHTVIEEFYMLLAQDRPQAEHIVGELAMRRSDKPWEQLSIEFRDTRLSHINGAYPVLVLRKGSKLDWKEYIADQLLPEQIAFVQQREIRETDTHED